jgi:hypothetical protein
VRRAAPILVWLLLRSPKEDGYYRMTRASVFGGLALLAVAANYQSYRLELVWLPAVAAGASLMLEAALRGELRLRAVPA